jgi:nitrogen fixation NifU-like protein
MLVKNLIGKSVEEADVIIKNYQNMINEEDYDKELLGELNAYDEVYMQPNRKKCALLPSNAVEKILDEVK